MTRQAKTRQAVGVEADDEDDDLFGTNDDDEDFSLFGSSNYSKSPSPTTLTSSNKGKSSSVSEAPLPATARPHHYPQRHSNNATNANKGGFPFFPATSVPKSAATGLFGNSGHQNITGLLNLTGLTQGVLNGSLILGDNNSITVYY